MKNLVTHCLVLALALIIAPPARATEPVKVVASFSILGDMVRNVAGSNADVTVLVGPRGCRSARPERSRLRTLADPPRRRLRHEGEIRHRELRRLAAPSFGGGTPPR
jgi:hypothetical protein